MEDEGKYGSRWITDTNAHTGRWGCLLATADTVFTSLTGDSRNAAGQTLPKLMELCGTFTGLQLTSGKIIAYNLPGGTNAVITFDTSAIVAGTHNVAYSHNVSVSGGDPVYAITVSSGTLPTGLTLTDNGDGTATIAGTPTLAGTSTFTLNVVDGNGANAHTTVSLTIA